MMHFYYYEPSFQDTEDTVIIIDEIQESAEIYNRIREFTRQFKCRFIVTGSYLGRVYDSEFRFSSGDVTKLTIYTLSYEEFLRAFDESLYEQYCELAIGKCEKDIYASLKQIYDVYCQIGGYPKVVETYLKNKKYTISTGRIGEDYRYIHQRIYPIFYRYFRQQGIYRNFSICVQNIEPREKRIGRR